MNVEKKLALPRIKSYISFLLDNHLDDATYETISLARKNDLPLLKLLSHLSEENLFAYSKNSLRETLISILEGRAIEVAFEKMEKWKANAIPEIKKDFVQLIDIVFVNSFRKRVFYKFLPKYTSDPEEIVSVSIEIDALYSEIDRVSLTSFVTEQQAELNSLNLDLKDHKEELQAMNEELKESHEELQAINEELREQIEIRRAIEEELQRESNFLKTILDNISDGIVVCDENGILRFFNKALREIHGITEEALPPEEWSEYYNLYSSDGTRLLSKDEIPLYRAFQGEKVRNFEMIVAPANGKKRILTASGERILSSDGRNLGAVAIMHDVTELKEARYKETQLLTEEATRKEAERQKENFERFFMNAPVPIGILNGPDLTFSFVNNEYQEKFFPGRALKNKPVLEALPELKGTQTEEILFGVARTGKPFVGYEVPIDLDRGKGKVENGFFNIIYEPTFSSQGMVDGVFIIAYEVTEQVNARKRIEENETSLRIALEAGNMGTWTLDLSKDSSNRTLEHDKIFGYDEPLPNWGYLRFLEHVISEDKNIVAAAFSKAKKTGHLFFETRIKRADNNEIRWIAVKGQTFYEAGKPVKMAGVVMDITPRKLTEQNLQQAKEELAASNEELMAANEEIQSSMEELAATNRELTKINADMDNFIYTASHDLKAPIANIEGLVNVLRRNISPGSMQKEATVIQLMQTSIDRFKKTINDLTDIVKIQKEKEEKTALKVADIIDEVLSDLTTFIYETKAEIISEVTDGCRINFSRKNLKSIIYNLLSNAIKYHSPERTPVINITCIEENQFIILTVKDNGLGIKSSDSEKIFSMFKRLHNHVEGSGIGLYIVKRILDNSGGKIEVESVKGEGSTFRVYFPK